MKVGSLIRSNYYGGVYLVVGLIEMNHRTLWEVFGPPYETARTEEVVHCVFCLSTGAGPLLGFEILVE